MKDKRVTSLQEKFTKQLGAFSDKILFSENSFSFIEFAIIEKFIICTNCIMSKIKIFYRFYNSIPASFGAAFHPFVILEECHSKFFSGFCWFPIIWHETSLYCFTYTIFSDFYLLLSFLVKISIYKSMISWNSI